MTFLDCWIAVAGSLFSQALAGAPELKEGLPKPLGQGAVCFAARLTGDLEGRFSVMLDGDLLESSLLGETGDARASWAELLREVGDAAAGELLAKTGTRCRVESLEEAPAEAQISRAFQLHAGDRAWTILVRDSVKPCAAAEPAPTREPAREAGEDVEESLPSAWPGIDLLLDVELEATLRFGRRELQLGELLGLGPGDVVQLDRHVADPVDLVVGDKIVARGEVVLVNGNFGLRVTDVAHPRKRLESVRCLF